MIIRKLRTKKFYDIGLRCQYYKTFFFFVTEAHDNKLECSSLPTLCGLIKYCGMAGLKSHLHRRFVPAILLSGAISVEDFLPPQIASASGIYCFTSV